MKCYDCPLCISDYSDYIGDGDIYCLVTNDYCPELESCKRTNKWILSQNIALWKDRRSQEESERWLQFVEDMRKEYGEPIETPFKITGVDLTNEMS